ncbi:MAG: cation:proton antiporter, partial [Flavobacteriia bacterium]|nr:cation:proton antiporter [Flavobacteriia bacterium]
MELLPPLINDLGLILITAAISVVLFKILKQPLVLGYIIAGYLAGPYFSFFPTVQDPHSIEVWAEIGVIFLLFSLGLEFSFKKLMKVGGSALITGGVHIVFMLVAGFFTGILLNWTIIDSIFLGAMLSMSSTTIILRAFDEMNLKGKKFVSVVFGALIIEDIVAILLMVLLTTISVSKQFAGEELLFSFLKLSFFLIIWFLVGIFFIPTLLRKTKKHLNDEMLLILSLGLCLLMVILGYKAGFSP